MVPLHGLPGGLHHDLGLHELGDVDEDGDDEDRDGVADDPGGHRVGVGQVSVKQGVADGDVPAE